MRFFAVFALFATVITAGFAAAAGTLGGLTAGTGGVAACSAAAGGGGAGSLHADAAACRRGAGHLRVGGDRLLFRLAGLGGLGAVNLPDGAGIGIPGLIRPMHLPGCSGLLGLGAVCLGRLCHGRRLCRLAALAFQVDGIIVDVIGRLTTLGLVQVQMPDLGTAWLYGAADGLLLRLSRTSRLLHRAGYLPGSRLGGICRLPAGLSHAGSLHGLRGDPLELLTAAHTGCLGIRAGAGTGFLHAGVWLPVLGCAGMDAATATVTAAGIDLPRLAHWLAPPDGFDVVCMYFQLRASKLRRTSSSAA